MKLVAILSLLALCVLAATVNVAEPAKVEFDFKKQLFDTIDLQLTTGGSYSQVIQLLQDLKKSLGSEVTRVTVAFGNRKAILQNEIQTAQARSQQAASDAASDSADLRRFTKREIRLRGDKTTGADLVTRAKTARDNLIEEKVEKDAQLDRSVDEHKKVLEVLQYIDGELGKRFTAGGKPLGLVEKQAMIQKLQTIGESSEIAALIALSSTFDQPTLVKLLAKLDDLITAIQKMIGEESAEKVTYDTAFPPRLTAAEGLITSQQKSLERTISDLKSTRASIKLKMTSMQQNAGIKEASDAVAAAATNDLANETSSYQAEQSKLNNQITLIDQAISTLQEKEKEFKRETK